MAAIFVALAEPVLAAEAIRATRADPSRSNLVSRLAEELGKAVRDAYGPGGAMPGALRDAVNAFQYEDPAGLPDSGPSRSLSAEPHSFCRVMTGACWDTLVALFGATPGDDRAAALALAAETTARYCVAAAETAPSGSDFFGRVARRIAREAAASGDDRLARTLSENLFRRRLLASPQVPMDLRPDDDPRVAAPPEGEPPSPSLLRAIEARLPSERGGEILFLAARPGQPGRPASSVLRGRRGRDLSLHGAEYGPADGAAVEISDAFALGFGASGFLEASRVHPAGDRDAEDARAFVRFLARAGRIADASGEFPDSLSLARERKSHAVVREPDGALRLRRVWIERKEPP
jgi:hypothetical protein